MVWHYCDVIVSAQITSVSIVYSTVRSDEDQRKHQSSASLAFVRWIHRWPVNSPHKGPVTWKMFPFDDVVIGCLSPHEVHILIVTLNSILLVIGHICDIDNQSPWSGLDWQSIAYLTYVTIYRLKLWIMSFHLKITLKVVKHQICWVSIQSFL